MNADDRRLEMKGQVKDQKDPQTYAIIGAAMEAHNQLGCGFLEAVYQEALEIELKLQGIQVAREVALPVSSKGNPLNCSYRADFICYGEIVVELKALSRLTTVETAQVLNYLKATGLQRGLVMNFGAARLQHERLVNNWIGPK